MVVCWISAAVCWEVDRIPLLRECDKKPMATAFALSPKEICEIGGIWLQTINLRKSLGSIFVREFHPLLQFPKDHA
jgi:hypothetical protein